MKKGVCIEFCHRLLGACSESPAHIFPSKLLEKYLLYLKDELNVEANADKVDKKIPAPYNEKCWGETFQLPFKRYVLIALGSLGGGQKRRDC